MTPKELAEQCLKAVFDILGTPNTDGQYTLVTEVFRRLYISRETEVRE